MTAFVYSYLTLKVLNKEIRREAKMYAKKQIIKTEIHHKRENQKEREEMRKVRTGSRKCFRARLSFRGWTLQTYQ